VRRRSGRVPTRRGMRGGGGRGPRARRRVRAGSGGVPEPGAAGTRFELTDPRLEGRNVLGLPPLVLLEPGDLLLEVADVDLPALAAVPGGLAVPLEAGLGLSFDLGRRHLQQLDLPPAAAGRLVPGREHPRRVDDLERGPPRRRVARVLVGREGGGECGGVVAKGGGGDPGCVLQCTAVGGAERSGSTAQAEGCELSGWFGESIGTVVGARQAAPAALAGAARQSERSGKAVPSIATKRGPERSPGGEWTIDSGGTHARTHARTRRQPSRSRCAAPAVRAACYCYTTPKRSLVPLSEKKKEKSHHHSPPTAQPTITHHPRHSGTARAGRRPAERRQGRRTTVHAAPRDGEEGSTAGLSRPPAESRQHGRRPAAQRRAGRRRGPYLASFRF
jgi:hypothetical protein